MRKLIFSFLSFIILTGCNYFDTPFSFNNGNSPDPEVMEITSRDITVDGNPGDWQGIFPVVSDPAEDSAADYEAGDIRNMYVALNPEKTAVFCLIEMDALFDEFLNAVHINWHGSYWMNINITYTGSSWEGIIQIDYEMDETIDASFPLTSTSVQSPYIEFSFERYLDTFDIMPPYEWIFIDLSYYAEPVSQETDRTNTFLCLAAE